jgi:hypothetical protein
MMLDNWGTVGGWTTEGKITSLGPSGIGFVNFGTVDVLRVKAPIETFKVPERIWFRAALPKNAGGKIQRGLLREQLLYEGNRDKDDCRLDIRCVMQ